MFTSYETNRLKGIKKKKTYWDHKIFMILSTRWYRYDPSSGHCRTYSWKQFRTKIRISLIAAVWGPYRSPGGAMWSATRSKTKNGNWDILCSTPKINLLFSLTRGLRGNTEQTPAARARQGQLNTHTRWGDESSRTNHGLHHECSDGTNAAVNTEQQHNINVL